MKFTFDYEETLTRRIVIEADHLSDAIRELETKIDNQEIVLGSEDFVCAEVRMPLEKNFFPRLQKFGESVKDTEDLDIVIDCW